MDMGFTLDSLRLPKRIFETETPHGMLKEEFFKEALDYYAHKIKELTG